jgi:hypothetical protein
MVSEPRTCDFFTIFQSDHNDEKPQIVCNMATERGSHLLKSLPRTISELRGSHAFFLTTGIDYGFLDIPVDNGPFTKSFKDATAVVNHSLHQ